MSIVTTREQRRQLERENARQPARMTLVPREHWPSVHLPPGIEYVWRSRDFLAQLYLHEPVPRLSVQRTSLRGDRWQDGISWEELMRVKSECGFGDRWAVECYPPDSDVVNVANMRHLWILGAKPLYGWHRAADRLAPPLTSNPATVLGALAPDIPRSQIAALETFCGQQIEIPATTVYTVTAYRWGDLDGPSYPVGCYATADEAVQAAQDEEADRGGKYGCEVVEWTVGVGIKERGGLYPFGESGSPVRIVRSPEA